MDRYSRWVAILKVMLPLAALGLLSTLFLLSRQTDVEATIPFTDRDIADRLRNQQITGPSYAGTSSNGEDIYVTAATISPPIGDKPAQARDLEARLERARGEVVRMWSQRGSFDEETGTASFDSNVTIETSTGYVIETQKLTAQLDASRATAPGKVYGTGPVGQFQAGAMEITPKNDGSGLHIVFHDGVRLVYERKQPEK